MFVTVRDAQDDNDDASTESLRCGYCECGYLGPWMSQCNDCQGLYMEAEESSSYPDELEQTDRKEYDSELSDEAYEDDHMHGVKHTDLVWLGMSVKSLDVTG